MLWSKGWEVRRQGGQDKCHESERSKRKKAYTESKEDFGARGFHCFFKKTGVTG